MRFVIHPKKMNKETLKLEKWQSKNYLYQNIYNQTSKSLSDLRFKFLQVF